MFALRRMVIGAPPVLEISEGEYTALSAAQKGLVEALFVEQKLALLVANYEELESDILRLALHTSLYNRMAWADEVEELTRLNRRMSNFLSSARLYIDQVQHHFSILFGKGSAEAERLMACASVQYDTRLGYRVMEALRNYSQHRGWPVHSVNRLISRIEESDKTREHLRHTASLHLNVERLRNDGGFKAAVLDELEAAKPTPDLKLLARSYLDGLGTVHMLAREILAELLDEWEQAVEDAVARYTAATGGEASLVAAVELDGARVVAHTDLFPELAEHRRRLAGVHKHLQHSERSVVSGY